MTEHPAAPTTASDARVKLRREIAFRVPLTRDYLLGLFDEALAEARAAARKEVLDENAIEDILADAESDGLLGPDYTPRRLAKYIADSLSTDTREATDG
jgi:hypothetical protein